MPAKKKIPWEIQKETPKVGTRAKKAINAYGKAEENKVY